MSNAGPRGGSEGEQLGPYRLVRKLGRGGMGEVWLAEHETIKSQVAIKLVLAAPDDEEAASRFLREAKATARIRHPGVVTVSDFGPRPSGGAYLVMELLDGESLAERLDRGALESELAIDLGLQIAEALAAAHASGVVHRDLKPANIFLVRDAATRSGVRVKLVDFGIAKATGKVTDELGVTVTGALVGTPVYMAPEQCTSSKGAIDPRTDLYALGVVLYQMLVGKPPFRGPTLGDLIAQHLDETPVPPRTQVPSIPAKLDVLIVTLLAKDKADRPASANDVARVLHELRGTTPSPSLADTMATADHGIDETVASGVAPEAVTKAPNIAAPAITQAEARPVPKLLIWGLVGGFALFATILVVIVLGRQRSDETKPPVVANKDMELAGEEMRKDKPDLARVYRWVQGSCDRGDQAACERLAWMFVWGAGVKADHERARGIAIAACEKGNGAACSTAAELLPVSDDRARLAYGYLDKGCSLGSFEACNTAGRRIQQGLGVAVDEAKATALLTKSHDLASIACTNREPEGCRLVGINSIRGEAIAKDEARGAGFLLQACELGSPEACGEVGEMYAMGAGGLSKDPAQAKRYLQMGCDRGAAFSCATLALALANGLLGPADAATAFTIAKDACEYRTARTCGVLGNLYSMGMGTPRDLSLAALAHQRACDVGDADSCAQVATIVVPGAPVDEAKATLALERACELASGIACHRLGERASKAAKFEVAATMFERACALSDRQLGCQALADLYFEGKGVPEDPAKGRAILDEGCAKNASISCFALGMRLRDGNGIEAKPAEALRLLDRACELGWGGGCWEAAAMLETKMYGMTPDPTRVPKLREQACKLDPDDYCKKR